MWNCLKNKTTDDITDTVANNNMNSVTSNAVYTALNICMKPSDMFGGGSYLSDMETFLTANQNAVACCGSQQILDGPDGNTWYNFIYIPHRTGVGNDNYQYGSLLLFNMTVNTNNMWICHLVGTNWYPPQKISV